MNTDTDTQTHTFMHTKLSGMVILEPDMMSYYYLLLNAKNNKWTDWTTKNVTHTQACSAGIKSHTDHVGYTLGCKTASTPQTPGFSVWSDCFLCINEIKWCFLFYFSRLHEKKRIGTFSRSLVIDPLGYIYIYCSEKRRAISLFL